MAELGDFFTASEELQKGIEVEMLDFGYVKECKDVEKIKGIVSVLRSGKEGSYPELLEAAETKMLELLPAKERSKVLRMRSAATPSEIAEAEEEVERWANEVSKTDKKLSSGRAVAETPLTEEEKNAIFAEKPKATTSGGRRLPPVRGTTATPEGAAASSSSSSSGGGSAQSKARRSAAAGNDPERVARRYRREQEYNRLIANKKTNVSSSVPAPVTGARPGAILTKKNNADNTSATHVKEAALYSDFDYLEYEMSTLDRVQAAEREKTKGNEFFKASEHEDAFLCYTRSILLDDSKTAAYSNRAIVCLKLNKLELAESDCNRALELEVGARAVAVAEFKRTEVELQQSKDKNRSKAQLRALQQSKEASLSTHLRTVVKILTRRGMSRIRLGRYAEASEDLAEARSTALSYNGTNIAEIEALLQKAKDKYAEVEGKQYVLIRDRGSASGASGSGGKAKSAASAPGNISLQVAPRAASALFSFGGVDMNSLDTRRHPTDKWEALCDGVCEFMDIIEEEEEVAVPEGGQQSFTRISITMSDDEDDDDEDEDVGQAQGQGAGDGTPSGGFSRIAITEDSESESDDDVEDVAVVGAAGAGAAQPPQPPQPPAGCTRIAITDDDDDEEEDDTALPSMEEMTATLTKFKDQGNKYMTGSSKDYPAAIRCYSSCVEQCREFVSKATAKGDAEAAAALVGPGSAYIGSLNNRAFAHLEVKNYEACMADCNAVLGVDSSNVKAFYRRAVCLEKQAAAATACGPELQISLLDSALKDATKIVSLERGNKQAAELRRRVEETLTQLHEQVQMEQRDTAATSDVVKEDVAAAAPAAADASGWEWAVEQAKAKSKTLLASGSAADSKQAVLVLKNALDQVASGGSSSSSTKEAELSLLHLLISAHRSSDEANRTDSSGAIITACDRAIALDPRNVKAYFRRAQAHMAAGPTSGHRVAALADCKRVLKIDPYNNEVLGMMDELTSSDTADKPPPPPSPSADKTSAAAPVTPPPAPAPAAAPTTPASPVSASEDCMRYKAEGNRLTTTKDYAGAVDMYSRGILCDPTHLANYSNRAQAHLKLDNFVAAVDDATVVVNAIQDKMKAEGGKAGSSAASGDLAMLIKVYFRRALGYKGMFTAHASGSTTSASNSHYLVAALSDINAVLMLDSANKLAVAEKTAVEKLMAGGSASKSKPPPAPAPTAAPAPSPAAASKAPESAAVAPPADDLGLNARSTTVRKAKPSTPSTPVAAASESSASTPNKDGAMFSPPVVTTPMADDEEPSSATKKQPKSSTKKVKKSTSASTTNAAAASAATAAVASDITATAVPTEAPLTVFEFERVWRVLRTKPSLFILSYLGGKAFATKPKTTYKKIVKASLSDEVLSYIFKNTYEQCVLLPAGGALETELSAANVAYGILRGISGIAPSSEFDMIVSVLSTVDIGFIRQTLDDLASKAEAGGVGFTAADVAKLKTLFKLA